MTGLTITDGILLISSIAVPYTEPMYETHSEPGKGYQNSLQDYQTIIYVYSDIGVNQHEYIPSQGTAQEICIVNGAHLCRCQRV